MPTAGHLEAARRLQEEEEEDARLRRRRGGGRATTTARTPEAVGSFRPFAELRRLLGAGGGTQGRTAQPRRSAVPPGARRRTTPPGAGPPTTEALPAGYQPSVRPVEGYTPLLPTIMRPAGGGAYPAGGGTGALGIGTTAGAPPPPAAPAVEGVPAAAGAAGAAAPGPEAGVDWLELGFGSQAEGEGWARAFASEHGGNMPWEEGTMSAQQNLAEHLAALQFGQGFQAATGRAPTPDEYRIQWYKSRFGLGPNWRIEGASPGGGMGWVPREYMGG